MGKYLLLRDNKESGPYMLDDLVRLGLKPYDLVWLEGKSAAWRYPSEINELKPYAPVAEEQPFDRFYKKNQEEKLDEQQVVNKEEKQKNIIVRDESPYAPPVARTEELKFVPKKSVFVTLPSQKNKEPEKKIITTDKEEPIRMTRQPSPPPTISITESPEVAEIKYSQPLDEIKEMYVRTLQQRKNKGVKRGILIANLKRASVIIGLVLIGLAAGFLIKSKPNKAGNVAYNPIQNTPINPIQDSVETILTDKSFGTNKMTLNDEQKGTVKPEETGLAKNSDEPQNEIQQPTTLRIRKETMIRPVEKEEQVIDGELATPGAGTNVLTGERNRRVRSGVANPGDQPMSKVGKNKLKDLVSVSSNDYKRVAFGGIRNLLLTITNNSRFELDHVVVELQYLKPSEEPLRTENIRFEAISPHTSATIRVPDTNRGIKVLYKIINIESKQSDDDVAGM